MKNFFSLAILFLSLMTLSAQNSTIGLSEAVISTSKGDKPGFRMFIPQTDEKAVADKWASYNKNFKAKPKFDKAQFEYFSDDALIPQVSQNTIDIYVKMLPKDGGILFSAAFDLGGIYISSKNTPDKFLTAENILSKFYVELAYETIQKQFEANQAKIKELENANKSLEADMERIKGTVALSEGIINNEMKAIENNELQQVNIDKTLKEKELVLIEKKKVIAEFSLPNIEKEIKTIEITAKKNQTEQERAEREIVKKEEQIKLLKDEIIALQSSFKEKTALLEQNQISIEELNAKINSFDLKTKEEEIAKLESDMLYEKNEKAKLDAAILKSKTMIENNRKQITTSESAISNAKNEKEQISLLIEKQKEENKKLETLKSSYSEK